MGKVSVVGAGMKSHPGVAAQGVHHARRRGHQHRDDLHLADQDLLRRHAPTRVDRAPCARCTRRSSSAPTQVEAEHPFGRERAHEPYRVAVVGATGAVGTVMLAQAARARLPRARDRPVRLRALGRAASSTASAPSSRSPTRRSRASTSRSSRAGGDDVAASGRRASSTPARSSSTTPRAWRTRPRGPARRLRGQPGGARRPQGPDRQPELLDDAADGRAQADPRRGRASSA